MGANNARGGRCMWYRNGLVRSMAARALVPFVPLPALPAFLQGLFAAIPPPLPPPAPRALRRHNEAHGQLEQVRLTCALNHGRPLTGRSSRPPAS